MATAFDEDAYQARVNQIPRDSGTKFPVRATPPSSGTANSGIHSTELGRNLYNAAMALPGVGGIGRVAATGGLISRGVNAGAGLANTASRGMAAMAGIPTPTSQPLGVPGTTPGGSAVGQKAVGPSPNLFEAAKAQEAQQVGSAPGVYKHGEGQYSDNAQGMGFVPGFTGQPSAQNMQAANALAGQQQKRSMIDAMYDQQEQQQAMQPRGFAAPQIAHSGNDFTARQNLRGLKMDAEWAMQRAPRKKYAMQDPAVMAYQAALQGDTAARYGGQAALEAKTNDTNAGLQREQMQQDGANQRERPRTMMDAVRLDMERKNQELANRPRNLVVALQEKIAAEQDAARRNGMVQRMRDIEGRNTEVDPYLVVPGGQQLNENGQAYTAPSAVFNRRTGDWLRQPGVAQLPSIDQNPQAIAIKNDTTMSKLQKMEALRKLGYS